LHDFELTVAADETEAVELATESRFDLILMACYVIDGPRAIACHTIRLFNILTPILFVTDPSCVTEEQAFELGAQGLVSTGEPGFVDILKHRVRDLAYGSGSLMLDKKQI
jgi:DNA-binding response OmpR family regulator